MSTNWSEILRAKAHKATPIRLAILQVLEKAGKPLSVHQLMKKLGAKIELDQATVYRTMTALKDSGLIRYIDFQHGHAHFELATLGDHHHVVCVSCHTVEDVYNCDLKTMTRQALRQSGFAEIKDHALEFFGVCQQCQIKN
jgi:Fe2+ or Zn2+ uptake regulation protein